MDEVTNPEILDEEIPTDPEPKIEEGGEPADEVDVDDDADVIEEPASDIVGEREFKTNADDEEETVYTVTIANYANVRHDVTISDITYGGAPVKTALESDGTIDITAAKTTQKIALSLTEKDSAVIESVSFGDTVKDSAPYEAELTDNMTITINTAPAYALAVDTGDVTGSARIYTYATGDNNAVVETELTDVAKAKKPGEGLKFAARFAPATAGNTLSVSYKINEEIDETPLEPVEEDDPKDTTKKLNFYTIPKADMDDLNSLTIILKENAAQNVTFTPGTEVGLKVWDVETKAYKDWENKPYPVIKGQNIKFQAAVKDTSAHKITKVVVGSEELDPTTTGEYEVAITKDTEISFATAFNESKCKKLSLTLAEGSEEGSATMELTSLTKTGDGETEKTTAAEIKAVLEDDVQKFEAGTGNNGVKIEAGKEYLIPSTVAKITLKVTANSTDGYTLVKVNTTEMTDAQKESYTLTDVAQANIAAVTVETAAAKSEGLTYFKIDAPANTETHITLNVPTTSGPIKAVDATNKPGVYSVDAETDIASFTIVADAGWALKPAYITSLEDLGVLAGGKLKEEVGTDGKTTYTVRLLTKKLDKTADAASPTYLSDTDKLTQALKTFALSDDESTAANKDTTYTEDFTDGVTPAEGFSVVGDTYNTGTIPYNAKLEGTVTAAAGYRLTGVTYQLGEKGTPQPCTIDTIDDEEDPNYGLTFADVKIEKVTDNVILKVETAEDYTFTFTGVSPTANPDLDYEYGVYTVEANGKYKITTAPVVDVKNLSADIKDASGTVVGRGRRVAGEPATLQIWMQRAWQGQELSVEVKKDGVKIGNDILLLVKKSRNSIAVNGGSPITGNVANDMVIPITTDGEALSDSNATIDVTGVKTEDGDFATFLKGKLDFDEDGNLEYTGVAATFEKVMKSKVVEETAEDGTKKNVTKWENAQAKIVISDGDDPDVKSRAVIMTLNPVMDQTKAPSLTLKDASDVSIDVNVGMDGVNVPDSGNGTLYYIITAVGDPDVAADPAKGIEASKIPDELNRTPAPVIVERTGGAQHVEIPVAKDGVKLGGVSKGWGYTVTAKAVYSLNGIEPAAAVTDGDEFDVSIATEADAGKTSTKDTYFASKLSLKKNRKKKPVSTLYTGQTSEEGFYVADLDWKDKFTPYKITETEVEDLTGGITAFVNENDELRITSVYGVGKHVLQVTAKADDQTYHRMYAARATINVNVVQGIYNIGIKPAQGVVSLPSGKNVVNVKTTTTYNFGAKANKPKTAKAEYRVVGWDGKQPAGVEVDKKGTVKITSAFPYNQRYDYKNRITVYAKAVDYDGNNHEDSANIWITDTPVDLTNLVVAKADGDGMKILAKSGEKKAVSVSALDLQNAYVYATKEAVTKDSYTAKEWGRLAKEDNYAIKYTPENDKKGKVAYVNGNGRVRVQKPGSVTINAAANDGSKNGKKSKNSIKLTVTPTETNSSAALVIKYEDANGGGTAKEISTCKKPTAELADKAEIKGEFQVSGAAKLNVALYFAKTDEKTGAFKEYVPAKGFESYKLAVKGGKNLSNGLDASNTIITTAKETTITLSTGKGKTARKYTYKLTNTAFKDSKPKITVANALYTSTAADTQTVSLKVTNGKENFPEKTTVKIEADRSAKTSAAFLESALAESIVAVDKDKAEVVFNKNYYYDDEWYNGFLTGTYNMIATIGTGTGTGFKAVCAPMPIKIKVVKRTAFTFKPTTSYTINPAVDGGAVLTGKDNVKGKYSVRFDELQNANDGKGKSNKFTHYFTIERDPVTQVDTIVLNTGDPEIQKLIYKPQTDDKGEVKKDAAGNILYTDEYLDEMKLDEINKADLVGYVRYTAEANDKFYAPYRLEDQYAKITVKLSAQKGGKVAKAVQKYVADPAEIATASGSKTQVNVKVNGQYVNVAHAIPNEAMAKSNAAELTKIAAKDGQITLEAASLLDAANKKGYTTNVIIVPATSIWAAAIGAEKDAAKQKAMIEKYGVSVKVTVKAAAKPATTPKPENTKPEDPDAPDVPDVPDEPEKTLEGAQTIVDAIDWTAATSKITAKKSAADTLDDTKTATTETAILDKIKAALDAEGYTASDVEVKKADGADAGLTLADANANATMKYTLTVGEETSAEAQTVKIKAVLNASVLKSDVTTKVAAYEIPFAQCDDSGSTIKDTADQGIIVAITGITGQDDFTFTVKSKDIETPPSGGSDGAAKVVITITVSVGGN